MKKTVGIIITILSLLFLASCNINHKAQSGVKITKDYTSDVEIDELVIEDIRLSSGNVTYGPKVYLKEGSTKSVKISMQESMEKEITVKYSSTKLSIYGGSFAAYDTDIEMVVEITGYVFNKIDLKNAVTCYADKNVITDDKFELDLSGASNLITEELYVKELDADISGASLLNVTRLKSDFMDVSLSGASTFKSFNVTSDKIDGDASGASKFNFAGKITNVKVSLSGASILTSYDLICDYLEGSLSGASEIDLTVNKQIKGSASGASIVNYKGSATSNMSTSGGSQVNNVK